MTKADVVVEVLYNTKDPDKTMVRTNAREDALEEILGNWVQDQANTGKNESKANNKDEYKIVLKLDLSDDTFYTESDTGNRGLTCGIIMDVLERLSEIRVESL